MKEQDNTLFLEPGDFGGSNKNSAASEPVKSDFKEEKVNLKAEKPNVSSSTKNKQEKEEPNAKSRMEKRMRRRWNPLAGYHNRSIRRAYLDKNRFNRSTLEIEDGVTPFQKWAEVVKGNIEMGKMRHDAFINDVVTLDMDRENARNGRIKNNLIEFYGSTEKAIRVFNENKRLENIRFDKKFNM